METGNRLEFKRILKFKVCTRRRSWVQQTVDQRRRVVVATQGRRAYWMTMDRSLRFEVLSMKVRCTFLFWKLMICAIRTQQRFAKLKLKKASSAWKTEIQNIQKNANATMVMIMRRARAIRGLGLELGVKLELNSPILCWQGRTSEFVFLLWRSRQLEIWRLTNSGVGDFSLDELGSSKVHRNSHFLA